jgi:MtrB/PioB family decaheme-associated outer membrane protein
MNMLSLSRPAGRCRPTALVLALLAAFAPASGRADTVVDASVSVGAGWVDHGRADRALFDQYSGLRPNSHFFGLLGADYYRRNDETGLVAGFTVSDLLNGNRELTLRYAKPGDWKFSAGYSELLRREPLVVTSGITGAGTTTPQVNTVAPDTGSEVDLHTKRSALGFGFSKVLGTRMQLDVSASTEHKEGSRLFGIGMACPSVVAITCGGTNGVQVGSAVLFVPEPIDADHHQLEARISYAADRLRLSLGYYGSFYRNDLGSLTVGVPGTLLNPVGTPLPISPGLATILGQPVALPPDNQAHQIDLTGAWLFSNTTQLNFKLARARATQHDSFAANGLTGAPAGVNDLGGQVDTTLAQVGFTARPMAKLSLLGNLRYENRDDSTPLALYNVVDTATFTNRQLPYRTVRGKLEASYQVTPDWRGTLGFGKESIDRGVFTPGSAAAGITALRRKTDETTWRAEARRRMSEDFSGAITLEHSERRGSNWLADNSGLGVTEVPNPNAPGTGFDRGIFMPTLADRHRDKVRFLADWQPTEQLSLQVAFDTGRDRFHAPGVYGLRSAALRQLTVDASYAITDNWSLTGYASQGRQQLDQGRPDAAFLAFRNNEKSLGLGVAGKPTGKLEVGANLAVLEDRSTFAQTLDATADAASAALLQATGGLPDIIFRQQQLRVFGKYSFDKASSVRAEVAHYRTRWNDWAWGFNGTPFVFSDGTVATRKVLQSVTVLRLVYTYRWQ